MSKNKRKVTERSKCCNAKVRVIMSKDFFGDDPNTQKMGTCHYECTKCHKDCDIFYVQRRTWKINPKTRIRPNKKKKDWNKLTKKEIEHMRKWEDF